MSPAEIKAEIGRLPEAERRELFEWFAASCEDEWDRQIERDFSPGGRGEAMLRHVNAHVDELLASGHPLVPLTEQLRHRRAK